MGCKFYFWFGGVRYRIDSKRRPVHQSLQINTALPLTDPPASNS